jgi:hypothetical protein
MRTSCLPAALALLLAGTEPALAFGANYLAAWADTRGGIYAARLTSLGGLLDPGGFAVGVAAGAQDSPALAFDGSRFLTER